MVASQAQVDIEKIYNQVIQTIDEDPDGERRQDLGDKPSSQNIWDLRGCGSRRLYCITSRS